MPERKKTSTLDGLDDLAKDEVFTFRGKEYTIPAISQQTAEKLSELAKNIKQYIDSEDVSEVLKFDVAYIALAMADGDDEKAKEWHPELKKWPRKVLNRISSFIATNMQGPIEEAIEEEEKDKAKK